MKPLLAVVAICLALAQALPQNIEDVKELPQDHATILEAEESEPQQRKERCTTCSSGSLKLNLKSPNDVLAAIQALPGAEVHSQQSFESCSSDKGCAGIKVKDGRVVERFGNVDSFKAAAAADSANEFTFHAGGALGGVFEGGIPPNGPFWWMNENSPFKNTGANFEKFSKSSSSFSSSGSAGGAGANGAGFSGSVDISANPFLNGEFSKVGFGVGVGAAEGGKPGGFQSSSFEQSSFSSSGKADVDLSKNPFLNGGIKFGEGGFSAQAGFGASGAGNQNFGQAGQSQSNFASQSSSFNGAGAANSGFGGHISANANSNSKFGSGYTGSSPSPFTASSNANSIQNTQKVNEFDFEQQSQTQQNIDEAFQSTGNVLAHEHSGGELQQVCAGQGYVCVHKAQCNNGVVNTNGAGVLQAKTQKQYCNIKTEVCCRVEIPAISGAGLQGSLGVGSATFSGSNQGSGLFATGQSSQGNFGAQGSFGQSGAGQSGSSQSGSSQSGASFGASFGSSSFGNKNAFGQGTQTQGTFGQGTQSQGTFGQGTQTQTSFGQGSQSTFGSQGSRTQGTFGQGAQGTFGQGSQGTFGQGTTGFSATGTFGSNSVNRGVSTNSGNAGSSGTTGFEAGFNSNKFGSSSSSSSNFGASGSVAPANSFANNFNNEVYKSTSQSNFIETDSFSAGSEVNGVYRPGATGLKPGIPYLPPDNVNQPTIISSTAIPPTFTPRPRPTTPRPTTPRPRPTTPRPTFAPSTAAPGYLPPQISDSSNTKEVKVPVPTYSDGQIILDENRQPTRPTPPINDIPAGCAAALKCTPIEYCTAEGMISNTTVVLTRDQETFRVPLTDCKDIASGRVGKCCRDPYYTDPWPTNQLGRWVPGVFGGNDGQYVPDSRGAGNNPRGSTVAPPVTGNVILNNFRNPKPTPTPFGPNQVTQGFGSTATSSFGQKGQFEVRGQGQFGQGGQGQYTKGGQGQFGVSGQGSQVAQGSQFSSNTQGFAQKGQGQIVTQGQGQIVTQGQGQVVTQGQGAYATGGRGQVVSQGQGQVVTQGQGQVVTQGQGAYATGGRGQVVSQGQGTYTTGGRGQIATQGFAEQDQSSFATGGRGQVVTQGQGQVVSQGQGQLVSQGQGQIVSQGQGQYAEQGQGSFATGGRGQFAIRGQGQAGQQGIGAQAQFGQGGIGFGISTGQGQSVSQGSGFGVSQGFGSGYRQGFGQGVVTGQGQTVSQGFGSGIRQGFGQAIVQGEGQAASDEVYRVVLGQYDGSGECGVLNGQKPYGNRNDLEVDFAEIPWQAMVLLQTNRSLLCGGVITRPDVVLTSASCVEGLDAKNVLIKGGEWKLGIDDEPLPFQIVQVKNILRHPFYKSGSFKNDVAVLVLTENLRLAKNIYPICLPGETETLDAFYNGAGECVVTGWGKQVLQAHLAGSIMHSLNVSLINPGECQTKLSADYPHLLEQYDQDSCACGQPLNPVNNICKVDIGSALACTTDNRHYVLRGIYSWDSGCQTGNQLAAFYKFDLEWYQWSIGLIESVRFAKYAIGTKVTTSRYSGQLNTGVKGVSSGSGSAALKEGFNGVKTSFNGVKSSSSASASASFNGVKSGSAGFKGSEFDFSQFGQAGFGQIKGPISNSFSASYSEKKVFQSEPQFITYTTKPEIVTFTTKPEIVTFTTKPEYFTYTTKPKIVTYTTKPKIVTYTTKPQIITYETSGSGTNPQYVAPGVTFNPDFGSIVGLHKHNAHCKCLENGKK